MDGWGINNDNNVSAIKKASTPFIDNCYLNYPNSIIHSSGLNVGLPSGQVGNSEVGHMNIGAGRVVYQNLVKINYSIKDGTFYKNKDLIDIFNYSKQQNKNIHIIGLISDGGVHSHINHLFSILKFAHQVNVNNIYIHGFTDGRDVNPTSSINYIKNVIEFTQNTTGKLASVIGRYYAMDRNNNWDRIKLAYDMLTIGKGFKTNDILTSINKSYNNNVTDEFIKPIVVLDAANNPLSVITNGDVVISFNFRNDRMRQITRVLTQQDMTSYDMHKLDIKFLSMTTYDKNFINVNSIFSDDDLDFTLGEVLSLNDKTQLRIAETEKYPHVTFFFSGGRENVFIGESRILCPSPKVSTYDLQPEMSINDILKQVLLVIKNRIFDFMCINLANPDMVGHTGNFKATVKACEFVDQAVNVICNEGLKYKYNIIITSDHGNSDCMLNIDGSMHTSHTVNPVPLFLVNNDNNYILSDGVLADIAPTVLDLMGLDKPSIMTGKSLLR